MFVSEAYCRVSATTSWGFSRQIWILGTLCVLSITLKSYTNLELFFLYRLQKKLRRVFDALLKNSQ